jgi:hypothetical protein
MRAEQKRLASMLGKVADAVTQIAATQDHHTEVLTRHSAILEHHSKILTHHSGLLEMINETQQNYGARLNAIDGRPALIEKHTGAREGMSEHSEVA